MKANLMFTSKNPMRREAPVEAFPIDDEAAAFAEELIAEVTSGEFVAEDARNEAFLEETAPIYNVDFTVFDEDDAHAGLRTS